MYSMMARRLPASARWRVTEEVQPLPVDEDE
jgi:hypothetical protein